MPIKKKWVSWEELEQIMAGISALFVHAASHHIGGDDLLDLVSITGFSTYLDQPVKQASSPTHVKLILTQATGTAPLAVSSQTLISSLNSDLWDNQDCPPLESGKFLTNDGAILKWMDMGAGDYHNLLSVAHPDTVPGTCAQGDIITGQPADILTPSTKDTGLGTDEGADWTGVTNIYASDGVKASVDLADGIASSKILATTFGFNLPANATVQGIKVSIEKRANTASVKDNSVRIIKGGVISGDQKASAADWPASDAYENYGSDNDLWGLGWSYSDINASNFGVSISVVKASGFAIASIDHIRITVYYTVPGYGWKKLVKGPDGKILQLVSGYPAWATGAGNGNGLVQFLDNFDDEARFWAWRDFPQNGTIEETVDLVLKLTCPNGVVCDWWDGPNTAPRAIIGGGEGIFYVETKLTLFTNANDTSGGLFIAKDADSGAAGVAYELTKQKTAGFEGVKVIQVGVGDVGQAATAAMPLWFRIKVSGRYLASKIIFEWSDDGINWTAIGGEINGYDWNTIGVYAHHWEANLLHVAEFDFFKVVPSLGPDG